MSPRVLAALTVAVLGLGLTGGCESFPDPDDAPDRDGPNGSLMTSTAEVCRIMNECGLWYGQESCEQNLLTIESCQQEVGYLACMSRCVALDDCFDFNSCESDCWSDSCSFGAGAAPF